MDYKARVVRIKVSPIDGANTIASAIMSGGINLIVGKETPDNSLGIFFPPDGQLSEEFVVANNLYKTNPDGSAGGGLFDIKRRVKPIKLMKGKVRSEGFWVPLSYLEFTKGDISSLEENNELDSFNGIPLCNKYLTSASIKEAYKLQQRSLKTFPRHVDTTQLRYSGEIPKDTLVVITEKLHGTSGRTGYVMGKQEVEESIWKKLLRKIGFKFERKYEDKWTFFDGTRNTVLQFRSEIDRNHSDWYRHEVMEKIKPFLAKGEIIYYEIVGYDSTGGTIMQAHNNIPYLYGCDLEKTPRKVFVYRIAMVNEDGYLIELPWVQVKKRCKELGLNTVPEITMFLNPSDLYNGLIVETCNSYRDGKSILDESHIREGVSIRAETPDGLVRFLKDKSFDFLMGEYEEKSRDDLVNVEEIN